MGFLQVNVAEGLLLYKLINEFLFVKWNVGKKIGWNSHVCLYHTPFCFSISCDYQCWCGKLICPILLYLSYIKHFYSFWNISLFLF